MALKWSTGMCAALAVSLVLFVFLSVYELIQWQMPCLYQLPFSYKCGNQCCKLECGSQPPSCTALNKDPWSMILFVSFIWAAALTFILLGVYLTCYLKNRKAKGEEEQAVQAQGETVTQNTNRTQEVANELSLEFKEKSLPPQARLLQYEMQPYGGINTMQMVPLKPAKNARVYRVY